MRRLHFLVGAIVLVDTMFFTALTALLLHYVDELELSTQRCSGSFPNWSAPVHPRWARRRS
jgi:hypothetical protein